MPVCFETVGLCRGDIVQYVHPWQVHMQNVTGKSGETDPTLKHHILTKHAEDEVRPAFKMKVTGVYGGAATKRLVSKAVKIRNTTGQMKRQEEWRQIQLPSLGLS